MANKYQTLSGFLLSPFHRKEDLSKDITYNSKYRHFIQTKSIKLHSMCIIEDSYYLHIKVPSESQKNNEYDVVLRFFTDKPEVRDSDNLRGYYIQFFSNSPSFMYQYAYLYNKEGFLIKALYNKLDVDYIDIPPEKTNTSMINSYDKSIYFACKFLSDMQFRYLNKHGVLRMKKVSEERFFRDISDFKTIKMNRVISVEEKKLHKELEKQKKTHKNLTNTKSITYITKKKGNKKVVKKIAGKTTIRKR